MEASASERMNMVEDQTVISVADFSRYPSGRDDNDGSFNGKKYRLTVLKPELARAISENKRICVSLEGVMSFGSSFLEEAFGGLVREEGFSKEELQNRLSIDPGRASFSRYEKAIWSYISAAQ